MLLYLRYRNGEMMIESRRRASAICTSTMVLLLGLASPIETSAWNSNGGHPFEVSTDKYYYELGELVWIRYENVVNYTPLTFAGDPILHIENPTGVVVDDSPSPCRWRYNMILYPLEYRLFSWNQRYRICDDSGNDIPPTGEQVPPGKYEISMGGWARYAPDCLMEFECQLWDSVWIEILPENSPPISDAGRNKVAFAGEPTTLDGSNSYDSDGIIVSHFWDFGDGSNASGVIVNHTYLDVGTHYVTLTVADDDGETGADTIAVVVLDPRPDPPTLLRADLTGSGLKNITLDWELSFDDGSGFNDVVNYAVYWSDVYDSSGVGYHFLVELPPGTDFLTLDGWGHDGLSNYFFYVQANDSDGYFNWRGQAGKFTHPLFMGPNLVSIPLKQSNESIKTVSQTLECDKAWHYDSPSQEWKSYAKFKAYNTLDRLNHIMGIWINVTHDSNLTVAGVVPAQTTIHLYEGWNLVSFPSFNSSYTVYDLRMDTGAVRVEGYDLSPPYHLRVLGDAEVLLAGYGYWVRVEAAIDWVVEVS